MTLYHGSNIEIKVPKIIQSKRLLDFGTGFYLTSDYEQAAKWAVRTTNRRETGTPTISVFNIADTELENLDILVFEATNKEWLRYISQNRSNNLVRDSYDIVIGPVAND